MVIVEKKWMGPIQLGADLQITVLFLAMTKEGTKDLAKNRRAFHDYEIQDTFEAGLVLRGTEVKSLRNHGGSIAESYVKFQEGELWLVGAYIAPYNFGNVHNHSERRDRKLLLHKRELRKLRTATQEKGMALVPIALYLKKGRVKVAIGLGKGKKKVDKRSTLKDEESKRRMQRAMRGEL